MFALPIIERELRVRARKPWTVWTRVVVGLLISLLAIESLNSASGWGVGTGRAGKALFNALSALLFLLCLVEGVRQTADCLSSEKREGTLGLLFLTDLTGFDVVLGKLAASSLVSFYMLLAAFPAMALALPAGGLTAGEFWRTQLVLLNTLFFSVAAGMWASARNRQEYRALTAGLSLVFVLTVMTWMVEWPLRRLGFPNVSPWVALALADDADYRVNARHFWLTLAATHGLAWALLVAAGRRLQAGWREEPEPASASAWTGVPVSSLPIRPPRAWRLAMTASPATWLANRLPTYRGLVWFAIVALALSVPGTRRSGMLHWAFLLIPSLILSFVATRSFAEARRSGAMELLLSTPLSATAIVEAHWCALWRQLLAPFWLVVGLFGYSAAVELVLRSVDRGWWTAETSSVFWRLLPVADCLLRAIAVCWLGLYMGLRMGSTPQAIGYCLLWIIGVPAVATMVLAYIFSQLSSPAFVPAGLVTLPWRPSGLELVSSGLSIAYSLYLVAWAKSRLRTRFRELAAGD